MGILCLFGTELICLYLGEYLQHEHVWEDDFYYTFSRSQQRIYTSSQIPFFIFSVSEWQFQNPVTEALLLRSQKLQPQNIHKDKIMETPQLKEKWNSLSACPHLPHTFENQLACQHHGERSKPAFYQWGWKHLLPFYVRVPWNLEYNIKWAGALCNFQTSRGGLTPLLIAKNSV